MARVLVVEDERELAETIREGLGEDGFRVNVAHDGQTGLDLARRGRYGAIVLDIMVPRVDGWEVCRRLRDESDGTPILMLTARGAPDDRVRGLEMGADDYLPKPFHFPELVARVRALTRRDRLHKGRVIRVADLEIDTRVRAVRRAGRAIDLSPREYSLLEALASREGQVLSRETVQESIWSDDRSLNSWSNTVDVHIAKLRKKVDGSSPEKLIQTIFGVGYCLRRPADAS